MTVFNSRASSGLKGSSLPETKSPNAGPALRISENFVARRGVDFVVFGDEGVISDAAVARHRLWKKGACVVDERIRREAGRNEAMFDDVVNKGVLVESEERATISHQLFDSGRPRNSRVGAATRAPQRGATPGLRTASARGP